MGDDIISDLAVKYETIDNKTSKFLENSHIDLNRGGVFKIKNNGNLDKFCFRLAHSEDDLNEDGIIRFNNENSKFEIAQNGTFKSFSKDNDTNNVVKNTKDGKSYFKRLNFSDNYLNNKNILNNGFNKTDIGNIFREVKIVPKNNINREFLDFDSSLIYSNPSFIYNINNLFNLHNHTITYFPNDNNSYRVYVRKNHIKQERTGDDITVSCFKNDKWENHKNITSTIKLNSFYEFSFEDYFPFYNNKFKKMYINSQGYISFTSGKKLVKNNGLVSFDMDKFNKGTISLQQHNSKLSKSLIFIGNINQEDNTILRNINGLEGVIDFETDNSGFIIKDTIAINNSGKGYIEGDILLIQDTNATIIVKTVRNDSEEITFSDALQDYSVNFLYGDLKFTYLSKVFIGLGKYREIVITFINLFYKNQLKTINCQIRLWDNNSITIQNKFKNKFLHYSDDYYELGSIEVSYEIGKINGISIASQVEPLESNISLGLNNVYIGISNYIDYNPHTFKPLNFGNLVDKEINIRKGRGVPKLECKLLFKSDNDINTNPESGNLDFQQIGTTKYYYYTFSDWTSIYLSDDEENKFYTNVRDLGKFNVDPTSSNVWSKNVKNFILFISSEFDYKFNKNVINTLDNITGASGVTPESGSNIICLGGTGKGCIVNYNINNNPKVTIVEGGKGYTVGDILHVANTTISFSVHSLKTKIIDEIGQISGTSNVTPTSGENISCINGDGSGCIANYNINAVPAVTIVDGGSGYSIGDILTVENTSITFKVVSTLEGEVKKYYSSSSIKKNNKLYKILDNYPESYLDTYLGNFTESDLDKISINTKSIFPFVSSLDSSGNTDNENNLKDYFDLYTNQYVNNTCDTQIYKIQFRKYDVSLNKKFSANIDVNSNNLTQDNNNTFEKISPYDKEEHVIMKVIYKLKSDDIPFNITFDKAYKFPINLNESIGNFGPYNIVKNNPIYFKATLKKQVSYFISIEDNVYPNRKIYDLKLELYDSNQNILDFIELPYDETNNPITSFISEQDQIIFLKIYGVNYKNFLLKIEK